jgi:hypothetical protein
MSLRTKSASDGYGPLVSLGDTTHDPVIPVGGTVVVVGGTVVVAGGIVPVVLGETEDEALLGAVTLKTLA